MIKKSKYEEYICKIDPELLEKWKHLQDSLKAQLIQEDKLDFTLESTSSSRLIRIGGMDISASVLNPDMACASLVVCDAESFEVLYEKHEFVTMTQPYVPGFLAFREVDHLLKLIDQLKSEYVELIPQVILVDGNGIFHSNRFGLACHLGVLADIPTIGCGKTVFSVDGIDKKGVRNASKGLSKAGDYINLKGNSGATWGAALKCTNNSSVPLIINIGHKISLNTAIEVVKSTTKFRVPEPVRLADLKSRVIIKEYERRNDTFDIDIWLQGNFKDNSQSNDWGD